jgi:serine protease Do
MRRHVLLALFLVLAVIAAACGGGGQRAPEPVEVAEATFAHGLSKQMEPVNPGNEFQPGETIYLAIKLKGNPKEGVVSTRFFYKDEEITRVSLDLAQMRKEQGLIFVIGGNTLIGVTLTHDQPFPAGDEYRAEVFANDAPAGTYKFKVVGPVAAAVAPTQPPAPAPTQPPAPAKPGAVSRLQDVKSVTIQIEAAGSFVHPQVGQVLNVAGRGSGFIIDPSGLAVTNNHVVTGAALLKVWIGGATQPRNAKILGVSECSDLAVIDIDGEDYPYLEWYEGDITTGLPIYAAGFPLGNPEYTLLQGIVSKERAGGETNWASVDHVIEHTALTNPGNSGGPVVTENGKLVAIHYAGDPDTEQHFAIARDEARPIIEQLRAGKDVNTIGVNGEAVNNGQGLSGIWVASVKSGSPADKTGVKGGDIITKLEGLVLATDGTMADYCDILRTHNPGDTLNIEVLRFATQEVLEGQLNGRKLEQRFSFAQQVEGGESAGATKYSGYTTVTDDSGAISIAVPAEWSDVSGSPWELEGKVVGAAIAAARNRDNFYNTWSEPGVFFGASHVMAQKLNEEALLDLKMYDFSDECKYEGRFDYKDPLYTGRYDQYKNCGGAGTMFINLAAVPETRAYVILVQVQIVSEADLEALDKIINSFQVIGNLPSQ